MAEVAEYGVPRTRSYGLPRRRGAINGLLLILLGAWGGLVPFFGPMIGLSYTTDPAWTFSWAKFVLEILPAAAAVIGGLGLIGTARHTGGVLWGWLAALGGAWFVVGNVLSPLWTGGRGEFGPPAAATFTGRTIEEIVFFYGIGAVIIFLAGIAIGRFTVPTRQDAALVAPIEGTRAAPVAPIDEPAAPRHSLSDQPASDATVTQPVTPATPAERQPTGPIGPARTMPKQPETDPTRTERP